MKKKIILTAGIVVAVIAIGCVVCAVLYSNGLLGFYHPQQQAKEGQVKIACVGDSITYGYGVKQWQQNNLST